MQRLQHVYSPAVVAGATVLFDCIRTPEEATQADVSATLDRQRVMTPRARLG